MKSQTTFSIDLNQRCHIVLGMVPERRWDAVAMLRLATGLLLSLLAGSLLKGWLDHALPRQGAATQSFLTFLVGTISFHGVGLILVHYFLKAHAMSWKEFFGLDAAPWQRALRFAAATSVLAIPLTLCLNYLSAALINAIQHHHAEEQLVIKVLQNTGGGGQRVVFGFAAIVLAPIVEESLFRGILYTFVKQLGYPMLALAGTSLLFAAIHANLMTFVPLTFLAMILVLLYERTQTLLAPIIMHSLFNAVNFTLFLAWPQK